jgi:hypothetical protein
VGVLTHQYHKGSIVNLHEASEHICQGFASLPATMKVVVLLYNNNNISMISNFTESRGIFEVSDPLYVVLL